MEDEKKVSSQRDEKVKRLRILRIADYIKEGTYPNANDLARHFNVSRPTIMRDLHTLKSELKAPLAVSDVHKGYYFTNQSFFVKNVMLTEGEILSVSVIQHLLEQYRNTPLEASMASIFEKMKSMLPDEVSVDTSMISDDVSFIADAQPQISSEVYDIVIKSLRERKTLMFEYNSATGSPGQRFANPYHIVCRHGDWYLVAYCKRHKDIRTFSLARISNAVIVDQSFEIPENFDKSKYTDPSYGIWSGNSAPEEIHIHFKKETSIYIKERKYHRDQKIIENEDGSVELFFMSNQIRQISSWVLGFGSAARVIAPESLKEIVKEHIRLMLKDYED